ncbi:MAG: DUF4212 domain-containing protein [Burkholderiales bacterium]|nr:DUF4212 domain-containing protein [Burkholderiales bacterium]
MNADRKIDALAQRARIWSRTEKLTLKLLLVWASVTLGVIFFARELSSLTLFGWPLSFYMAAQGALLVYLAIVVAYAWRMHRTERSHEEISHDA